MKAEHRENVLSEGKLREKLMSALQKNTYMVWVEKKKGDKKGRIVFIFQANGWSASSC